MGTDHQTVRDALAQADRLFPVNDDAAKVEANSTHRKGKKIRDRFVDFHLNNPQVYTDLVDAARSINRYSSKNRLGIGLLYERLRWLHYTGVNGDEPFRLSNDFRAEYARLIMVNEPDLRGMFRIRSLSRKM